MNNRLQTIIYVVVAAGAVLAAVMTGVSSQSADQDQLKIARQEIGKQVFKDFRAEKARELEIVTYDEDAARLESFSVKRDELGQWVIPSHSDYPADAEQQMAAAATAFSLLTISDLVGTEKSLHEEFAVIEPNSDTLDVSNTGVGTQITVIDDEGQEYSLIIGEQVERGNDAGADPRMQQVFYAARKPGGEITFTVDLDMDVFETEFSKWIESNLLDLNGLDLNHIDINDYAIFQTPQGRPVLIPRSNSSLVLDETDNLWQLDSMMEYDDESNEPSVVTLTEEEELDAERIETLKSALENLEINGVARKPEFLNPNLRASSDSLSNPNTITALSQLGLYGDPSTEKDGLMELKSANGEIHVSLKTGVKYILRFGEVDTATASEETVKRYLFVTARMDEAMIPQPELSPLPEGPPTPEKPAEPTPEKPAEPPAAKPEPEEGCQDEAPAEKPEETQVEDKPTETPEDKPTETPEDKPAETPSDPPEPKEPDSQPVELTPEQLEELREQITKENARKTQAYQDQIDAARNRVRELNERFEKWYYVIDEKVYNQIHLSNTDLIKAKKSELDDFNNLEGNGLGAPGLPGLPNVPGLPPVPAPAPNQP